MALPSTSRRYVCCALTVLLFWALSGTAFGETPDGGTDTQKETGSDVKNVPVKTLSAMNEPEKDIIFVIDNSGSMKKNDPEFITRDVVTNFSYALMEDAHLGMVLFDQEARLLEPLNGKTDNRIVENIQAVDYSGQYTNSPAGIERAIYELKTSGRPGSEKAIIFITDGIVDTGNKQLDLEKERWLKEELAEESRKAGIRIFGIAFTEKADFHLIQALALKTDGEYFRAYKAVDIPDILTRVIDMINTPQVAESKPSAGEPVTASPDSQKVAAQLSVRPELQIKDGKEAGHSPVLPAEGYHKSPATLWEKYSLEMMAGAVLLALVSGIILLRFLRNSTGTVPTADAEEAQAAQGILSIQERPEAKLIDVSNASSESDFPLDLNKNRITVGRDEGNDISIPNKTISGFHATFEFKDGYYYIEDQRSTNGTKLNASILNKNQPVRLKSGDKIDFSEFEFRFIILDQDPAGKTVILGSSAVIPESNGINNGAPKKENDGLNVFKKCLHKHLERIRDLGPSFEKFVAQHFDDELIQTLAYKAAESINLPDADRDEQTLMFAKSPVLYNLCALPLAMDKAADWFNKEYEGYTKYLGHLFESDYFKEHDFNVLCVIVYGRTTEAWISVTIVPIGNGDGNESDDMEIMSYEFLSEDEKRSLALNYDEIGRII